LIKILEIKQLVAEGTAVDQVKAEEIFTSQQNLCNN